MPGHSQKQDEKAIEEEDILIRAAEQWELPEDHTSLEVPLEEFSQILAAASRKDKEEETDLVDMQRSLTKKRTSSRLHIETVLSRSRSDRLEKELFAAATASSSSPPCVTPAVPSHSGNRSTTTWKSSSTFTSVDEIPPPPPPILLREHHSYASSVDYSNPGNLNSTQFSNPTTFSCNSPIPSFWNWLGTTWMWPNQQQTSTNCSSAVTGQPSGDENPNHGTSPPKEILRNKDMNKNIPMERTASSSSNATSIMTEEVNDSFEWPMEETAPSSSSDNAPVSTSLSNVSDDVVANKGSKQQRPVHRKRRLFVAAILLFAAVILIVAAIAMGWTRSSRKNQAVSAASREGQGSSSPSSTNNNSDNGKDADSSSRESSTSSPSDPNASAPGTAVSVDTQPTVSPTASPTGFIQRIVPFGAVGDVPYTTRQQERLKKQILNLDGSAIDFLVHVGDVRNAEAVNGQRPECMLEDYQEVAQILRRSPVPVFILMGDNDWNDCPNMDEGLEYWHQTFLNFESRHWDHSFEIMRLPGQPDTFSFIHKDVLFIGLNIVGGYPSGNDEEEEWEIRLTNELAWTKQLILDYQSSMGEYTGRVVIFAHADPNEYHGKLFFDPLVEFMEDELQNDLPILHINGDWHEWSYDNKFYGQSNYLRIMLNGEGIEPPTTFHVVSNGDTLPPDLVFNYERQECDESFDDDYDHNDD